MATTRLSDLIVPEIFEPYLADEITRKTNLIQSGTVVRDGKLDSLLNGGGASFNMPFYDNLTDAQESIATDNPADIITPNKNTASNLVVHRCVRTSAWEVADLDEMLTASDPMGFIASRVADYRLGRLQEQFLSVVKGIFANNATATDAYHTQNDQRWDVSGAQYVAGTTDFNVNHLIDAISLMGDAQDGLGMIMVTYIFGQNQFKLGFGAVKKPLDIKEHPEQGNGYGVTTMYNRWCNAFAPKGYSFVASPSSVGGPSNTEFETAGSWRRVVGDVRSVKMVELVTRELA